MKNKYNRLKWLAVVILAMLLYLIAEPARAGVRSISSKILIQQEVRGVVTDTGGIPLPGVTVLIKGSNRGTTTNIDGKYSLTVVPDDVLIFSFLGFRKLEEPVNGRREVGVELVEDISSLGEVQINAGYYNTTKRESTGNISRVTAEEIELQPVISPLQALQGRMAGVEIIPGGSHPGMASTIRIRGQNSLRSEGNFPLYIIDGVPINSAPIQSNSLLGVSGIDPLNSLDISNIKSIEVLKDADATAIYGSRGANGVVLITTKKGLESTGLQVQFFTGASTVPNRVELLETPQYLQMRQQAFENDEVEPDQYNAYDLLLWEQDRYTDWQDFFFGGTSETTRANINYSGGNENTSFQIGTSYSTQGTVYPGDYDYKKITGNISLNHFSVDGKFNLNLSSMYGVDINNLSSNISLNSNALQLPPNAPAIFTQEGNLNWEDWAEAGLDNPLAGFFNTSLTESRNLLTNVGISYEIIPGLKIKSNLGYTFFNSNEVWKRPVRSYNPSNQESHNSFHLNLNRRSWIIEPQLLYNGKIGELNFETIAGATFQESTSNDLRLQGAGYAAEILIGNLAAADQVINSSTSDTKYRYSALFGRLGANWKRKYYLNLTARRDASSRFGPSNRSANFGAVGAAWIFTEEEFVSSFLPFLSFGKFRGSYGTTGNDQIGDYGYLDAYEATAGPGGLYPTQLSNSFYSWEVNKKLEAAVELAFFKDRINFNLSWYRNRSANQLVGYPLPSTTGFSSVQANLPATVQNTGWEFETTALIARNKNFHWLTSFNISLPKNELISYPRLEQSSFANTYRVGHPLNISLLYKYNGLDPQTGFYTIQDVNEDQRFDYKDRVIIQDNNRKFFGGINNNITFKGLSLQFLWEFVKQEGSFALFNTGRPNNSSSAVLQSPGEVNRYQRISQSSEADLSFAQALESNFAIEEASFLRLKTLSLSYSFSGDFLEKIAIQNLKLFLHGQNLATITRYSGLDPELPIAGVGFGSLRTFSLGAQLNL